MNYIELNRTAYDKAAEQYKKRVTTDDHSHPFAPPNVFKWLDPFVANKNNPKLLDIGFGSGSILKEFSQNGYKTTGIDLSPGMCKVASEISPESLIINANVLEYDFAENSFDIIFAGAVLHNFPKSEAKHFLAKVHKYLIKTDGIFFIDTSLDDISDEGLEEKKDYSGNIVRYRARFTDSELTQILKENGFEIIEKTIMPEENRNKIWQCYICKPI